MHPFRLARTPSNWLRALLVALTLGFALNAIAHVGHTHDAKGSATHQVACGYCVHLGALGEAPAHSHLVLIRDLGYSVPTLGDTIIFSRIPALAARPRGPPSV